MHWTAGYHRGFKLGRSAQPWLSYVRSVMDITQKVELRRTSKKALLKELGALLLFVVVGGVLAMPCLCIEGAITGRYKVILFLLVSLRLGWSIYKRTFQLRDYFIYFAVVVAFCLWTDSRF